MRENHFRRDQLELFLVLLALGLLAQVMHLHVVNGQVPIDGRWALCFAGFALLRRRDLAVFLAVCLSLPVGSDQPLGFAFLGNLLHAVPSLVAIRYVYARSVRRAPPDWRFALTWILLVLACYQLFVTPVVSGTMALMDGTPLWTGVLKGWTRQPFLAEYALVTVLSGAGMTAFLANQRLRHIRRILLTVRTVKQLSLENNDTPPRLIEKVCAALSDPEGYHNAWIALMDTAPEAVDSGTPKPLRITHFAAADGSADFTALHGQLAGGRPTSCLEQTLTQSGAVVIRDPSRNCVNCPLARDYIGTASLSRGIKVGRVTCGILAVSAPADYAEDPEAQALFNEMADDLGMALERHESERRIHEQEHRFRTFVEHANDIVYALSLEGTITYVSPNWAGLIGEPPEAALGRPVQEYVHPADVEVCRRYLAKLGETGRWETDLEYRVKHADGSWHWHVTRGSFARGADGQPTEFVGISRDTDETRRILESLRDRQRFLQALLETTLQGVCVFDNAGKVLEANRAMGRILGHRPGALRGMHITQLHAEASPDLARERIDRVMRNGSEVFEAHFRHRDGHAVPVEVSTTYVELEGGRFVSFFRDLTEARMQEERIAMLGRMLDTAPVSVTIHDADGHFLFANQQTVQLHGYDTVAAFLKVRLQDVDVPDSAALVKERVRQIEETGEGRFEVAHRRRDGSVFPLEVAAKHIVWEGKPSILSVATDISERKESEAALTLSETKWRDVLVRTPQIGISLDPEARIVFANRTFLEVTGWSEGEVLGQDWFGLCIPPEVRDEVRAIFRREMTSDITTGLSSYENEILTRTGELRNVAWANVVTRDADGGVLDVTCLGIDLTERRRAEEALRESEQRVRHKLEAVLDPEGDIGELSLADIVDSEAIGELLDHLNRLTGFAAGLVDPEGNLLVASGRREICTRFHRPHPEAGRNCMYSNRELIRDLRPGSFHMQQCRNHLWDAATPIVMGGRNVGSLFMGQFILAEEEPPPEVFRDQARRFGFDEREYLDALNRVPRWSRETVEAAMAFYGRFASLVSSLSYGALKLARTLEERRRIEEERERLQEELNHAQRMESVGRLAGGVAHDSNNMLNVILGHADMMLESAPEGSLLQDELLEIQRAAQRSADLTRQLLAFARRQPIAPRVLDLNRTVESALRMLGRLIGEHIDLVWNPAADLASVRMDPSQIDQILTNLCVNARDAIGEAGGTVTIRTENAILGDKDCAGDEAVRPGRYVVLGVSDTGGGMGSETMANLFEPFFTTKDTGKGTGLGLPTVFGIVKQNKGLIRVSSEPGQGAHFRIYLPAQTGIAASERSGAETTGEGERTERGTETLLLVEDEPATLSMIRQMLERSGYEVLATTSPEEAIRLADGNADRIRMLITDVVMPGTNGRELAGRLLAAHPHSRQLFMSGYNADFSAERGVLVPGVNFIQKPFSLKDLTAMVRRVLDRPEHG